MLWDSELLFPPGENFSVTKCFPQQRDLKAQWSGSEEESTFSVSLDLENTFLPHLLERELCLQKGAEVESIEILYSQNWNSKSRLVTKGTSCERIKNWKSTFDIVFQFKNTYRYYKETKYIKLLLGLQWPPRKYVTHSS